MISIGGLSKPFQRSLVGVLGIDDPSITDPECESDDPKAHMERVRAVVEAKFLERSTAHWLEAIGATGVPVAEYHTQEQVLDLEQTWANEYLIRLDQELLGGLTLVTPPSSSARHRWRRTTLRRSSASTRARCWRRRGWTRTRLND
jgi:crotonobetainyl-CoA:carnitine CoA-transferase CaiB-like acyl-CoA transferase